MEKRIPYFHFMSVKAVAKAIDPHIKSLETLKKKYITLNEEYNTKLEELKAKYDEKFAQLEEERKTSETQINALEVGILQATGFHVSQLVKKVIEPTGKVDKQGKPIKNTDYVPTEIVSYDKDTKEFVITIPDENQSTVAPTTEEAGNTESVGTETNTPTNEQETKVELPW